MRTHTQHAPTRIVPTFGGGFLVVVANAPVAVLDTRSEAKEHLKETKGELSEMLDVLDNLPIH